MAILTATTSQHPDDPHTSPAGTVHDRCALCGRPTSGSLCASCSRLPDRDREPGSQHQHGEAGELAAVFAWCPRCDILTGQAYAGGGQADCTACGQTHTLTGPPPGWNPRTCPYTVVPDPTNPLLCGRCAGVGEHTYQGRTRGCRDCAGTGRS